MNDIFTQSAGAILVDYRGLEMNELVELRKKLNECSSQMRIIKNTLAKIAAKDTPFEEISSEFVDTCALVYSTDEVVKQAKVISDFAKENDNLKVKAGILSDQDKVNVLNADEVQQLASLPSKEELVAKLLFLFNAPITNFVRTLNEVPASFVRTLAAIEETKN